MCCWSWSNCHGGLLAPDLAREKGEENGSNWNDRRSAVAVSVGAFVRVEAAVIIVYCLRIWVGERAEFERQGSSGRQEWCTRIGRWVVFELVVGVGCGYLASEMQKGTVVTKERQLLLGYFKIGAAVMMVLGEKIVVRIWAAWSFVQVSWSGRHIGLGTFCVIWSKHSLDDRRILTAFIVWAACTTTQGLHLASSRLECNALSWYAQYDDDNTWQLVRLAYSGDILKWCGTLWSDKV